MHAPMRLANAVREVKKKVEIINPATVNWLFTRVLQLRLRTQYFVCVAWFFALIYYRWSSQRKASLVG